MKKYCLVIDTSASSPEQSLYVYFADTIKACRHKLIDLKLKFELGYVYCATIGRKSPTHKDHYSDILRTDNGYIWNKVPFYGSCAVVFNPKSWPSVDSWKGINEYRDCPRPALDLVSMSKSILGVI